MAVVAACGTGTTSTPTLPPLVTPGSTDITAPPIATVTPRPSASQPTRPAGWDDDFCTAFAEVVIAQQLARDIGRALGEDDRDDAAGLAHELGTTVEGIRALIGELPEWTGDDELLTALGALLDEDEQLVTFYLRYLEQDRAPALDRAHGVEVVLREQAVPAVETALAKLARQGLTCPGLSFDLETP
jgi:hypothetical protein